MLKNIISTLFTKGFVAMVNLAILLVSAKQLGSDVCGQVSLLILNIAIIQAVNEIYTGYTLVYFIPKYALKKIYTNGVLWTVACTLLCTVILILLFVYFDIGIEGQWIHIVSLCFIIIIHSFHGVIMLAKEQIKIYNFLNFFQPALLLLMLLLTIFYFKIKTVDGYIIALYVSFSVSLILSSIQVWAIFKKESTLLKPFEPKIILRNGFFNQLANLSHMLSNRYNFYLLGNTILVGIYSRSTSLIESVWIISGSVSPIILTYIANEKDTSNNGKIAFLLAKLCFILGCLCIIVLYFLPRDFFVYLLGIDFIHVKTVMLYLSPGILFISFSTIISHYYAGLGKQKILVLANVSGLLVTVFTSHFFVSRYQLLGACYATCLSYFVAAVILTTVFMKQNKLPFVSLFKLRNGLKILKDIR